MQTKIDDINSEILKTSDPNAKAILEYKKAHLETIKSSLDTAKTKGEYNAINDRINNIENEINGFKSQFKTDGEVTIKGVIFDRNDEELLSFKAWSKELNRQKREFNALTTEKNKVMRKAAYKNYKDGEIELKVNEYYPNLAQTLKTRFDRNWNLKRFYFEDFNMKKLWKKENLFQAGMIGLSACGGNVAEAVMYSPCARFNNTGITSFNRSVSLFADSNYDNGDVYSQEEFNGLANACGLEVNDIENIDEKEEA